MKNKKMNPDKLNYLKNKGIIKDVFEYEHLDKDLSDTYGYFEKTFKELLADNSDYFNINNCLFYIKNGHQCNAFASRNEEYNIISITNAYPILMHAKFEEKNFRFILLAGLGSEVKMSDSLADLFNESNFNFRQFMLDCSIYYTFNHEFRHLLQFNACGLGGNFSFAENFESDKYDFKKHTWEYDADRIASFEVLKLAFIKYTEFKIRNDEKMKWLIYLSLASLVITKILFYFGVMNQPSSSNYKISKQEFYTKQGSHPHPLVRITYIIDYYWNNILDFFPKKNFSQQELLNNVMNISKIYLFSTIPNQNIIQDFFEDWIRYTGEINKYNLELYETAINDKSIRALLKSRGTKFED